MRSIYIAGSFKNLEKTKKISEMLSKKKIANDYSKPGDLKGIDGCLERIQDNDIVLVNNPDEVIGKSVAFDIGYALALGKDVFSIQPINDPPISHLIKGSMTIEQLIDVSMK